MKSRKRNRAAYSVTQKLKVLPYQDAELVRHATTALNIDQNVKTVNELVAVDQGMDVFDDVSEQLECENENPEPLKPETTVSERGNALNVLLRTIHGGESW